MLVLHMFHRRLGLLSLRATSTMSYGGEGRRQPWKRGGGGWGRGRRYGNNSREDQDGDGWGRGGGGRQRGGYRGGRRGRRWEGEEGEEGGGHGERERRGGGGGGRGRHPSGLSGREIGMFYREKSLANAAKREKEMTPVVNLQGNMKRKIRNLLDDINTADNIQPQPFRSGASLDKDMSATTERPSTSRTEGYSQETFARPNTTAGSSSGQRSTGARGQGSQEYQSFKIKSNREESRTDSSYDPWMDTDSDRTETGSIGRNSSREATGGEDNLLEQDEDYDEYAELPMDEEVMQNQKEAMSFLFDDEMDYDSLGLSGLESDPDLDQFLMKQADSRKTNRHFMKMMDFRKNLPSFKKRKEILEALESHQCLVISGETGCGKTTQVPQFILDDYISHGKGSQCKVICTQPRRISAISVAERVADERGQNLDGGDIGYSIRLERKLPRSQGSLLFCTTGILLKYLESDPSLNRVSHIIVDEIHERDLLSDFLLIILKDLLPKRPNLKVILMSATLNAEQFSSYFNECPMLHIPGFTYPVKEYWLEDSIQMTGYCLEESVRKKKRFYNRKQAEQCQLELDEKAAWVKTLDSTKYSPSTKRTLVNMDMTEVDIDLIHQIIHHICFKMDGDGAILVFVPGMAEIKNLNKSLVNTPAFNNRNFRIIPLHSLMPTVNQREVFDRPPPGVRKIIIATNIAETSITIDDVVYVVDAGKIKIKDFEPESNLSTLSSQWVSKANARQRRGRAGRVQEGVCFHLFTSLQQESLIDYQLPEILRTPLEELCLQIKLLKLGMVEPFINKAMQQPSPKAVHSALTTLQDLKALDEDENLLPLGHHLARLPVDPKSGKMILFGAMFGCLDPICTIAASLSFKNAFVVPLGKEAEVDQVKSRLSEESQSDHIMLVNAFKGWERAKQRGTAPHYCFENFLSSSVLKQLAEMKGQFAKLLHDRKFVKTWSPSDPSVNINSDNENLVKAIICAGLYPNVAKLASARKPKHYKPVKLHLKGKEFVYLHPSSVNKRSQGTNSSWFIYHKKMKTEQVYLYDTSVVSPYSLLMFGGEIATSEEIVDDEVRPKVTVDDWILFWTSFSTAQMVKDLRLQLDRILEEKIKHPGPTNWSKSSREGAIMSAITELLTTEELVNYRDEKNQQQRHEQYQGYRS
ncbi:ATP-dependent DNA/RNA helicase DHX36-like [Pecten maximus]|uniref:ATP-dependent DNA/RNA helicase DHX36-like n=1 Tax=Pecten maximus TaxID=6579 RepID=UPI0014585C6B|nr:ATP-dependent DNA/RNA helicase DHX36-like [Pecten maximus]